MGTVRCLRSKRLRAALWRAAGGRCALCGCALPSDWHADHVEPFCHTRRTNVHEMQPLCPQCNLKKGAGHAAPTPGRIAGPV